MIIRLSTTKLHDGVLPDYDESVKCPDHPESEIDLGFGLAGGGFGSYTVCATCCKVLTKTNEDSSDE